MHQLYWLYTYLCINYIGYTYARVGIEVLLTQQRCCANFQVQIVVFSYTCLCAIILTLWILHYKTSTVFCFIFPGCCNIILVFETLATNMKMRALKKASKNQDCNLVHGPLTQLTVRRQPHGRRCNGRNSFVGFIYVE